MIDLTVKTLDSHNHVFSLEDDQITVRGFKEYIAESVAVPADSQRLIYCGRVLQDEKKLNDYDVNGKVIHLVQRAPPQPGQRGNDGNQSHGQPWPNSQRTQYRLTRAQMHGNAMYLGAMSVPTEIVEGQGLPAPQLSNTLSHRRLLLAGRMLDRINELIDRLNDPNCPLNPASSESNQSPAAQQVPVQEVETEPESNNDSRTASQIRFGDIATAAIVDAIAAASSVTLPRANTGESTAPRSAPNVQNDSQTDAPQPQPQPQPQAEQQGSTSNSDGQSNRPTAPHLPRPPQMAELLERLLSTDDRLRPFLDRYCELMATDPVLQPGPGPNGVEENQRIIDGVSEILHYMSHACHALSDIILDMDQRPPRNLRCRPIVIHHSTILQPGIPLQLEAHISLHNQNGNNNNGNEEANDSASANAQGNSTETNTAETSQQQESENPSQQQGEQQHQDQAQTPFGTVFNLPTNVEVLMQVSPESNIEIPAGGEPTQPTENNNNNAGRMVGTAGAFPLPDFIRNLMQAVAGQIVQSVTTLTTRNPNLTMGGQPVTGMDSGSTNTQSTQARSNVGTHPTTATQTRSTSRPHVFHHQQTHHVGLGMSLGQGLDFDPFLPCNSHHVRRATAPASNTAPSMSQGTRSTQTPAAGTQTQTQTATTSTTPSATGATNTSTSTISQTDRERFMRFWQRTMDRSNDQSPTGSNAADPRRGIRQTLGAGNIHIGTVGDSRGGESLALTLADFLENRGMSTDVFTSQESGYNVNFVRSLCIVAARSLTIDDFSRLQAGSSEPLAQLRRPLQEFLQSSFPNTPAETLPGQVTDRLLSQLRPLVQNLLTTEDVAISRNGSRVDICATAESVFRRHIKKILQILFNNDVSDARFGQEVLNVANDLGRQLCTVLSYTFRDGQSGLETIASRGASNMLEGVHPEVRSWMLNRFRTSFRTYTSHLSQTPETEILPLLIYKDVPSQASAMTSTPVPQPPQAQSEPMETEIVEERTNLEAPLPQDDENSATFTAPSDWVPIIARDGHQLQMQGMPNGGVGTFSDAYLGTLPTKRRKLIEQQKPRLLVSPTPNHSAIAASMERLVRESITRTGVGEVEGAAIAVAVDPGVRRAFGQAIRDCLNPHRYGTPDFPDPLRFPNATKYFSDHERPSK